MDNIIQNIQDKLTEMERVHDCRILFAIESGSRAWGFASQDSDYDVRCVYYHPVEKYLSINSMRDVIEWELNDVYDINGWDIRKALQLAMRSNITIFEWAYSPVIYRTSRWHEEFRAVISSVLQPELLAARYVGMAESTYKRYLTMAEPPVKQYFYAIRPLLAAHWVLESGRAAPVPFAELRHLLPPDMEEEINTLLVLRRDHTEKARVGLRPKALEYICREIESLHRVLEPFSRKEELPTARLDVFFRRIVTAEA